MCNQTGRAKYRPTHMTLLDNLLQDARFAVRQLQTSWVFTCTAVVVLALGMAASVAIFAFVDAALLCGHPPSLPGICARSAVFCGSRQEVRESPSSRRVEAADSSAGLSAGSGLAPGPTTQPWSMDGIVSAALRSQAKLPGRSQQELVLLLRLWSRR